MNSHACGDTHSAELKGHQWTPQQDVLHQVQPSTDSCRPDGSWVLVELMTDIFLPFAVDRTGNGP